MLPGEPCVDFSLPAFTNDEASTTFTLSDHKGKMVVIMFYPGYGYVTPLEFYELDYLQDNLKSEGCEVVAIATENLESMRGWWSTERRLAGLGSCLRNIWFASDVHGTICKQLGVYKEGEHVAFRSTFLIDPNGDILSIEKCDLPVGLRMAEQLRQVQAWNALADAPKVAAAPEGWKAGQPLDETGYQK